jgi:hypothetical protein
MNTELILGSESGSRKKKKIYGSKEKNKILKFLAKSINFNKNLKFFLIENVFDFVNRNSIATKRLKKKKWGILSHIVARKQFKKN